MPSFLSRLLAQPCFFSLALILIALLYFTRTSRATFPQRIREVTYRGREYIGEENPVRHAGRGQQGGSSAMVHWAAGAARAGRQREYCQSVSRMPAIARAFLPTCIMRRGVLCPALGLAIGSLIPSPPAFLDDRAVRPRQRSLSPNMILEADASGQTASGKDSPQYS